MTDTVTTNEIKVEFFQDPVKLYRWVLEDRKNDAEWNDKKNKLAELYKRCPVFAIHGAKNEIWIASKTRGFESELIKVSGEISRIRGGTEELFDVDPANTLKLLITLMFSQWTEEDELVEEAAFYIGEKGSKESCGIEYEKHSFIKAEVKEEDGRLLLIPAVRSYYRNGTDDPEGRIVRTVSSNKDHVLVRRTGRENDPVLVSVKGKQDERFIFNALHFSDVMDDKVKFFYRIVSSMNEFYEGLLKISPVALTGQREHRDYSAADEEYMNTAKEILKGSSIYIDDRLSKDNDLVEPVKKSIERVCAAAYTGISPVLSGTVKIRCDGLLCVGIKNDYIYAENGIVAIDSERLLTKPRSGERKGRAIKIFTRSAGTDIAVCFSSGDESIKKKFKYSGGYGIIPEFGKPDITISLIDSDKTPSDAEYFAAKADFQVVQHVVYSTARKIKQGVDSITEKLLSELMIKADIRDRVIRCFNADDCCGWTFIMYSYNNTKVLTSMLGGSMKYESLTERKLVKRFPEIASTLDSEAARMFISTNTGAIYEISETSVFPLPDAPLFDRKGSRDTAKAFLDFWHKKTGNTFLYFSGMWDNRMKEKIAKFTKIRKVRCINSEMDEEFIRIFADLVCVSRIRVNEIPVLPFPFKYLREFSSTL